MQIDATTIRVVGGVLIGITTLVAGTRLAMALSKPKKLQWDDFWLGLAYIFFLTISTLYIWVTPTIFRLEELAEGKRKMYPTVLDDSLTLQKVFFVTTSGLWFTLWAVKASLLALYKRLIGPAKIYLRIWWGIAILSFIFLVGAVTSSMVSCSSMHAWFTAGACSTPRDIKAASISLWYAFAVDILTDLMIMFLPIFLVWNLQMPLTQKMGVGALFCLGWVCITVAIIRVRELGSTVHNSQPKTSWLALWGIVETSIAVIIGCGPGLYRKAKAVYKTHQASYLSKGYGANGYGAKGYGAKNSGHQRLGTAPDGKRSYVDEEHDLSMYGSGAPQRTTTTVRAGSSHWHDDASSQEELRGSADDYGIKVTKTVNISVAERDPESPMYHAS